MSGRRTASGIRVLVRTSLGRSCRWVFALALCDCAARAKRRNADVRCTGTSSCSVPRVTPGNTFRCLFPSFLAQRLLELRLGLFPTFCRRRFRFQDPTCLLGREGSSHWIHITVLGHPLQAVLKILALFPFLRTPEVVVRCFLGHVFITFVPVLPELKHVTLLWMSSQTHSSRRFLHSQRPSSSSDSATA